MEDCTPVGLVCIISVSSISAVETGVDLTNDEGGVGWQFVGERRGVPFNETGHRCSHANNHEDESPDHDDAESVDL